MFAYATGWLGWPPSEAEAATFPDIRLALDGKVDFLNATTPGGKRKPRHKKAKGVADLKARARAALGMGTAKGAG